MYILNKFWNNYKNTVIWVIRFTHTANCKFVKQSKNCLSHLIIPDKALVHSPVFLLDRVDPEHGVAVSQVFSILHPADALDGVALVVALEVGRTTVVNDLLFRLDFDWQWGWNDNAKFDCLLFRRKWHSTWNLSGRSCEFVLS